jgi:hypothetical protein
MDAESNVDRRRKPIICPTAESDVDRRRKPIVCPTSLHAPELFFALVLECLRTIEVWEERLS